MPTPSIPACPKCGEPNWELIRTTTCYDSRFIDEGKVSGWLAADSPNDIEEHWYCTRGHQVHNLDFANDLYTVLEAVDADLRGPAKADPA